jgi:hypothetical protein
VSVVLEAGMIIAADLETVDPERVRRGYEFICKKYAGSNSPRVRKSLRTARRRARRLG